MKCTKSYKITGYFTNNISPWICKEINNFEQILKLYTSITTFHMQLVNENHEAEAKSRPIPGKRKKYDLFHTQ